MRVAAKAFHFEIAVTGKATAATQARLVDPDEAQFEGRARDLAIFNLPIDSKLRGCDVVVIRVEDIAAGGYTADRATLRQKKPPSDLNCANRLTMRSMIGRSSSCSRVVAGPTPASPPANMRASYRIGSGASD